MSSVALSPAPASNPLAAPSPPTTTTTRARVLALLKHHGWNATSFQVLEDGFEYWFDGGDACVAYVDTGHAWVAAGAPIAAPARLAEVTARFVAAADVAGRRASFFAAEERLLAHTPLAGLFIGEQPVWDPARWDDTVRGASTLRSQIRRAQSKGVRVRGVPAEAMASATSPVRAGVDELIARWLRARNMAPMGFLVDVQPFTFAEERRYFVAERDDRVVGFLAAVPVYARDGWLLEDLLRDRDAPNGTAELLVDTAIRSLGEHGSRYVTLGLAPLAGPVSSWLARVRDLTRPIYDFSGLRAFKAKLRPHAWAPVYLAAPPRALGLLSIFDSLVAFARGKLARFVLESLLRGPAPVLQVLAILLVPWTILLAISRTQVWFPAAWVQHAWVAFDAVVCVALFQLARRFRLWLAVTLAVLVTGDAVLTWREAFTFNLAHLRGLREALIVLAACAAPTLAAAVLWGAVRHRAHASPWLQHRE